jgi:FkbM family methyltransferase
MDVIGGLIRVAGEVDPSLGARLTWIREKRRGDAALRALEVLVRPGTVAVDVGANWGFFAYHLARLVGPRGRVYAIEPDPRHLASLRAIQRRRPHLAIHPVGLSDRAGAAELHVPVVAGRRVDALASLAVPRERAGVAHERVRVELARLDDLLPATTQVAFVKCDVEGHELAVLRGADGILRRHRPALLVEIEQRHQEGDIHRTFEHLAGLGYEGYQVRPGGLRPLAEFDLARDQLAFLGAEFMPYAMPDGYVHDFVFVAPGTDVARLLGPANGRRPAAAPRARA